MKKLFLAATSLLCCMLLLTSCFSGVLVMPDNESIGEPKEFVKDGIALTLTERFIEENSEMGFYAYYTSDFCGVTVTREPFDIEEGLEDLDLDEYTKNVARNNGHRFARVRHKFNSTYYKYKNLYTSGYAYCYKGSDSFWIVQFMCRRGAEKTFEDLFLIWAEAVVID